MFNETPHEALTAGHIDEPAQMQLVCHRNCRGWAISVFSENQIGFAAAWIISFEGIGPM